MTKPLNSASCNFQWQWVVHSASTDLRAHTRRSPLVATLQHQCTKTSTVAAISAHSSAASSAEGTSAAASKSLTDRMLSRCPLTTTVATTTTVVLREMAVALTLASGGS